jgi:hypothetical protein
MSKNLLYLIAALGGGYLIYRYMNGAQSGSWLGNPNSNPNFSTQPSQQYPYTANVPPRVDSSNAPWYGGDRTGILSSGPNMDLANAATDLKSVSNIASSVQSLWQDLGVSDWFSNEEPSDASYDYSWEA